MLIKNLNPFLNDFMLNLHSNTGRIDFFSPFIPGPEIELSPCSTTCEACMPRACALQEKPPPEEAHAPR